MKKINWENVLAILLVLMYGLLIGYWFGNHNIPAAESALISGPDLVETEQDSLSSAEAQNISQSEVSEQLEDVTDIRGVFDVDRLSTLEIDYYIAKGEMEDEFRTRAAYLKEREESHKIQEITVLYDILDDLSDSQKIKVFGCDQKISKKAKNKLKEAIADLEDSGYKVGFVMMDMDYGFGVAYNPKEEFYSASALKGPYVGAAVSQMPEKVAMYESTISSVLQYSSNDGYERIRYGFGPDVIQNWYDETNITTLRKEEHYSDLTSVDLGKLWVKNWEFLTSGTEDAKWVKGLFEHTLNSVMDSALGEQKGTKVYSKAGWIGGGAYRASSQNDAGIVVHKGESPYLMVILTTAYCQNDRVEKVVEALDEIMQELRENK